MTYKKKSKPKEKTVLKVLIKRVEKPKLSLAKRASNFLNKLKQDFKIISDNLPLELGVTKKLYAIYYDTPHRVINTALYQHTKSRPYLLNLSKQEERFKLCGESASNVDEQAKKLATTALKKQVKEVKQHVKKQSERVGIKR